MSKSITFIALILMSASIWAQTPRQLDSMLRELTKVKSDTTRIHLLIKLADEYLDGYITANRMDSAHLFIKQASELNRRYRIVKFERSIDIFRAAEKLLRNESDDAKSLLLPLINDCRQSGDLDNELRGLSWLTFLLPHDEKNILFRLDCYQRQRVLLHKFNRITDEMVTLKEIADIHIKQRKYTQAESELFQVIKGFKQPSDLMNAYDLLGAMYAEEAEYNKALFYALKTVRMMQLSRDSGAAITFYTRIIHISGALNKPALQVQWAKKALEYLIHTGTRANLFIYSSHIVRGLIDQGKANSALAFILHIKATFKTSDLDDLALLQQCLGDCYSALHKYAIAEKSYAEMINVINKLNVSKGGSHYPKAFNSIEYMNAGDFYLKMGNYRKARGYLLLAIPGLEHDNARPQLNEVHLSLFKVDSALGNYKSAAIHLQQSMRIKDSIFTVTKNRQIEELQIQYQTEEKDKNLKLAQNKAKLEQVQLNSTQNTRNWIIAGSGLLIIIAGLLYRQNRLKQKTNKVITQKNDAITQKNDLLQNLVEEKEKSNELITQKNQQLQNLVEEKEWLLKEVHHRVKNNLHSVICLLEAQAAHLEKDALQAIENSQHRIYTMSLIHQKLYQSEDVKTIDMAVYIPELVEYLSDSFDTSGRIHFKLKVEQINLNASQAIPLALIINEALTNSIKYAFPDGRMGEISISLTDLGTQYKMELADNGVGMPKQKKSNGKDSMGLRLIKGLTKEIKGTVTFKNNNGVKITIIFGRDLLNDLDVIQTDYLISPRAGEIYV